MQAARRSVNTSSFKPVTPADPEPCARRGAEAGHAGEDATAGQGRRQGPGEAARSNTDLHVLRSVRDQSLRPRPPRPETKAGHFLLPQVPAAAHRRRLDRRLDRRRLGKARAGPPPRSQPAPPRQSRVVGRENGQLSLSAPNTRSRLRTGRCFITGGRAPSCSHCCRGRTGGEKHGFLIFFSTRPVGKQRT